MVQAMMLAAQRDEVRCRPSSKNRSFIVRRSWATVSSSISGTTLLSAHSGARSTTAATWSSETAPRSNRSNTHGNDSRLPATFATTFARSGDKPVFHANH